jgi:SnoaL-like domain
MDAATVQRLLEQHFTSGDPEHSHAMYHDDAVLEFPQSGERFEGVENLREWRSR